MFRKLRGVRLPYNTQGYIYFTCATFSQQPPEIQKKIEQLCSEQGGAYAGALFDVLTKAELYSVERIATDNFISAATLYRLRRKYYEAWPQTELEGGL